MQAVTLLAEGRAPSPPLSSKERANNQATSLADSGSAALIQVAPAGASSPIGILTAVFATRSCLRTSSITSACPSSTQVEGQRLRITVSGKPRLRAVSTSETAQQLLAMASLVTLPLMISKSWPNFSFLFFFVEQCSTTAGCRSGRYPIQACRTSTSSVR